MKKLQGKDLINVGIFTAIYFVVFMAVAMLGFIPIFLPLLIAIAPLIAGIVMMLYYSKIQKFGMVSLTGLICGILMLLTGMGYWSIITGFVFGVLADLILKSGDYKSAKKGIISHGVFSMWIIGNYIPIVVTRDSYYQDLITGYSQEYADAIMGYISAYTLPLLLIAGFVCGVIGAIIGHDKISDILHRSRASFLQLLRFLLDHIPVSHLLNSRQKRAAQFITDSGLMIQYQ